MTVASPGQQRQSPRIAAHGPAPFQAAQSAQIHDAHLLILSSGGATLISPTPVFRGVALTLTLHDPVLAAPTRLAARVSRVQYVTREELEPMMEEGIQPPAGAFVIGIQFTAVPQTAAEALNRYIEATLPDEANRRALHEIDQLTALSRRRPPVTTEVMPDGIYAAILGVAFFAVYVSLARGIPFMSVCAALCVILSVGWLIGRTYWSLRTTTRATGATYTERDADTLNSHPPVSQETRARKVA